MGNASGREEDAAGVDGDGADVEDGGGDSSVRSSERGFPPYGSGGVANHVRRACSVGVVGGGSGAGSPPGSPGHSLSPRMFVPQVRDHEIPHRYVGSLARSVDPGFGFLCLFCSGGGRVIW